jgi:hypothetical protein
MLKKGSTILAIQMIVVTTPGKSQTTHVWLIAGDYIVQRMEMEWEGVDAGWIRRWSDDVRLA